MAKKKTDKTQGKQRPKTLDELYGDICNQEEIIRRLKDAEEGIPTWILEQEQMKLEILKQHLTFRQWNLMRMIGVLDTRV